MKKLCFALLLVCALTLSIEINNIHNGYRNVYKGTPALEQETLSLTSYTATKTQLTDEDIKYLKISEDRVSLTLSSFVRQFYPEDIDSENPEPLTYRYYYRPSLVLTISSEDYNDQDRKVLAQASNLGKDINDADL